VNEWRLPLAFPARKAPIASAGSSGDRSPLNDIIARSLESSGLRQQAQGHDIGLVIAKALSSAGLQSVAPELPSAHASCPEDLRLRGISGGQFRRQTRPTDGVSIDAGQFLEGSFQNAAGIRNYKLYAPSSYATGAATVPLVVMLHGCTQSPDDFAAGTQMNRLAERDGFLVLYPEQSANANGSNCWNWFRSQDQQREAGEPSLIAGMASQIVSTYRVDPARVYVAGLSAGAAMAVILGATYPDVFAAVGAHSGLAYGAAQDVASAFAAMKGGGTLAQDIGPSRARMPKRQSSHQARSRLPVPTIVFHGDQDHTVDARNGDAIAKQAIETHSGANLCAGECERALHGHRNCSRIVYTDAANRPVVEHWILHGAGHAWSGGDPRGSYVDARGPSASGEMMRFFLSQARAAAV
jgi:poly(hydroxyalkanoate) depolymerase family esterase